MGNQKSRIETSSETLGTALLKEYRKHTKTEECLHEQDVKEIVKRAFKFSTIHNQITKLFEKTTFKNKQEVINKVKEILEEQPSESHCYHREEDCRGLAHQNDQSVDEAQALSKEIQELQVKLKKQKEKNKKQKEKLQTKDKEEQINLKEVQEIQATVNEIKLSNPKTQVERDLENTIRICNQLIYIITTLQK